MRLLTLTILLVATACSFPKDPEDSLQKAHESGLLVGIVDNPPYTSFEDGKASGSEVEMVEEFARREGLKVKFIYGTESVLVKQLEEYRLHIIIGGFEKKTVWKDKAGLTTTYDGDHVFFIAKGENELLYRLESYLLTQEEHGS